MHQQQNIDVQQHAVTVQVSTRVHHVDQCECEHDIHIQ